MPFNVYTEKDVVKPRRKFLPARASCRQAKLDRSLLDEDKVLLEGGGEEAYDILRSDGTSERALFIIDKKGILSYIDVHDINKRPPLDELIRALEQAKN